MSQSSNPAHQKVTDTAKTAGVRVKLQNGYALLARGEPQVWFTGGMLVICLLMIVSLLGFIVYAGLPTFWPREVHWLLLDDGSFEIGQLQKVEAVLGTDNTQTINRYYRTGNFDLTGQHYRWLSGADAPADAVTRPQWAMVVERLEHGRLYGILNQITIELDAGEAVRKHTAQLTRMQETLVTIPELPADIIAQCQTDILAQSLKELNSANRSALAASQDLGSLQFQVPGEDQWKPVTLLNDQAQLTNCRQIVTNQAKAFEQLRYELQRTEQFRRRVQTLRYEISRLDAKLAELRAEVRRAELKSNQQVAAQLDSSHYILDQILQLAERTEVIADSRVLLQNDFSSFDWYEELLQALDTYESDGLPQQLSSAQKQLTAWLAPIDEQSPWIRDAVANYLAGYQAIASAKRPLESELAELNSHLARAAVSFIVPVAPVDLEIDEVDLEQLRSGLMPATLKQALATQAIHVSSSELTFREMNERFAFGVFRDDAGQQQWLSIATDSAAGSEKIQWLQSKTVDCEQIVRCFPANQQSWLARLSVYSDRWREFLFESPREAGAEGGVFPAIWGTIVMTLIMTIAVVPFGVMAALYLREYTKAGPLVSIIRISINNLAGVPSIVYGVFGFSFFCYTIGAYVDGGAKNAGIEPWPPLVWYATLGAIAIVGTVAFFFSFLSSGPSHSQTWFKSLSGRLALFFWLCTVAAMGVLLLKSPFFHGFYPEYLPNPTFGKGGLLWAALTLALLTLPVVIVATEEALAAVPNSLREGSLACGASKWQTIRRIVLPHARPGILTGAILAMARGAGEVAPLMLVGALASAPDLPLDGEFPFFHGSRSFMHLGYQIYVLGFQSQNSEAAKPMVFTCTLLLILIVATLNITAIAMRSRLKRQFQGNQF